MENRSSRGRKLRLKSSFIRRYVVTGLKRGLSPEQISGRLTYEHSSESISHEAIYQWIYSMVYRNGWGYVKPHYKDLRPYLKRRHKRRVRKGMRNSIKVPRFSGISIETRPKAIDRRKTVGHWEGDSVVSRKSLIGLNTLVERKTGLVYISKIKDGTKNQTSEVVISRLSGLSREHRQTLTLDNGSENAGWRTIEEKLEIQTYFCHPYCSGERGTNENTNGLIRWYFPKGTDFATISDNDIKAVEEVLNNRPRKRLGWKTPLEAFNESVALTS